jgi:MoaA/NifB/PqqE/SkfB family radical SAM enzyme
MRLWWDMASIGLLPDIRKLPGVVREGKFLTFVLPAPGGCNLACAFCLIRQRREIAAQVLQPEDYVRFIREVAAGSPIYAIAIQGYEPLLPATLPYTQAVLAAGRMLNLPTGLVTNGTHLRGAISLLKSTAPDTLAISLDAAEPEVHDSLRGTAGAWAAAVDGIVCAVAEASPRTELAVNSVLIPSRRELLDGMPALLAKLGIRRWIVTPLQKVGTDRPGGPVGNRQRLYRDLLLLQDAADREGIPLEVDDELGCLGFELACEWRPALRRLHVRTIPPGVELVRLTPSGEWSTGHDILRRMPSSATRQEPAPARRVLS